MIPKSGYRFSEKIMLKQQAKAKGRFTLRSFRFSSASGLLVINRSGRTANALRLTLPPGLAAIADPVIGLLTKGVLISA
jgi:hypothetical protein